MKCRVLIFVNYIDGGFKIFTYTGDFIELHKFVYQLKNDENFKDFKVRYLK